MRKIYTLLFLLFMGLAHAQVPNSDFEGTLGYGQDQVASWGQFFMYTVSIDMETGEPTTDQIIFDPEPNGLSTFCSSVLQAHSGERAMLIRNAFNLTQNLVLPGKVNLFNSGIADFPTGWNTGVPVAEGATINMLGFHYKFFPLGNDVAEARLELFNSGGESLGTATVTIEGLQPEYTYAYAPLLATSDETPTFMTITFSMQKEGSAATFGSNLIIDDVIVNSANLHTGEHSASLFAVYPTVADNEINIIKNGAVQDGHFNIRIIDINGRVIKEQTLEIANSPAQMDVSALSKGVYLLQTQTTNQSSVTRFIKR